VQFISSSGEDHPRTKYRKILGVPFSPPAKATSESRNARTEALFPAEFFFCYRWHSNRRPARRAARDFEAVFLQRTESAATLHTTWQPGARTTCAPSRQVFTITPIPNTNAASATATTLNDTTPLLFCADANITISSFVKADGRLETSGFSALDAVFTRRLAVDCVTI
jgi:hypothetical protein